MMKTEYGNRGKQHRGSLRDLLYVIFGHKWKMLAFMIVLFGVVVLQTFLQSGIYRSEARLLVRLGRETVSLGPTATIGEIANITRTYDWEVNSEMEILRSREIIEQVVDGMGPEVFLRESQPVRSSDGAPTAAARVTSQVLDAMYGAIEAVKDAPRRLARQLGLSRKLSEREEAIERAIDNLKIKSLQNTSVISLAYEDRGPELAKDVLDTFIQAFLDKHMEVYSTDNSEQFFEQQVAGQLVKLRQAEVELQDAKNTMGISSLEDQRLTAVNNIGMLELGIAQTEGQLAAAVARVAELEKLLEDIPATIVTEETTGFSDYAADLMRSRLYDLRLQEKDLAARHPNGDIRLEFIRQQVREGEAMLAKEKSTPMRTETRTGINAARKEMQIELFREQSSISALRSKLENGRQQVVDAKHALQRLNEAEHKIQGLQRQITLLTNGYNQYFEKLEEARIEQALKGERISNISILQAATLPVVPVGPGKMVRLALGLALAIAGAVGFAFLCEHLDHSIKTPEDVQEKLELPTLASIPRTRQNRVHPVTPPARRVRLGGKIGHEVPMQWDLPTHLRRPYVAFREKLLLTANGASHTHYIIGVTSCSRCEGVSTVAANLASSLAEMGSGAVLLVDANPHDPSVHQIFQTRLSPGLLDIVTAGHKSSGDDKVIHRAANLSVLTAGGANGSPVKTLTVDHLVRFLHTTKQDYRFVVVDMPALDEDGSVVRLAGLCDGVVLVVETERLRWEAVLKARQQLQQWNINILGVLLNKRRFPVPNWVYSAL
jgi:uncharacterized protein involved in exopolysaccharide biosynthesis/Mrp family chromosome partitioning ATPase